jgi:hypothetical protein
MGVAGRLLSRNCDCPSSNNLIRPAGSDLGHANEQKSPSDPGPEGLSDIDQIDRNRLLSRSGRRCSRSFGSASGFRSGGWGTFGCCRGCCRSAFSGRSSCGGRRIAMSGTSCRCSCRSGGRWSCRRSRRLATNDQSQSQESQILLHHRSSENSASTAGGRSATGVVGPSDPVNDTCLPLGSQ